jgi:hypothetical protein
MGIHTGFHSRFASFTSWKAEVGAAEVLRRLLHGDWNLILDESKGCV